MTYKINPIEFKVTGRYILGGTQLAFDRFDDIEVSAFAYEKSGKISEVSFGLLDFLVNFYTFLCVFPEMEDDISKQYLLPDLEYGYKFKLKEGNLVFMGLDGTYIGEAIYTNVMRDVIKLVKSETLKAVNEGRLNGVNLPLLEINAYLNTNY